MKKLKIGALVVGVVFLLASAQAVSAILIPAADKAKERTREKIVFIHYKKGFAKPPWAGGGKKEPKCYDFLGRGVKWQELPVDYVIDPDNPDGLSQDFVTTAVYLGAEEWDNHTGAELFGAYSLDYDSSWDIDAPDGRNELLFGDYPQEGVIAVTVVWGYFSGPPSTRKIIEFDILFDTDFGWGDAILNPAVMDLQNIATHEIGHGAGLDDVYDTVCSPVTMYGYSDYGETQKRDLATPDIKGIQELYGE